MKRNSWLKRGRWERRMDAEFQFHLQSLIQDYVSQGFSRSEAELRARREFGPVDLAKEECRDERPLAQLDQLLRDVRYACRTLRKSPGFAVAATLTLALGIGANTAIFSVLQGVVLAPLPYREPERLVVMGLYNRALRYATNLSYPDFLDWQRNARTFEQIAAFKPQAFDLTSPGTPEHLDGKEVSSTFFSTLRITLAQGRNFSLEEDRHGGMPAVIISDRLWQQRFGRSPTALGKLLTLSGVDYTIIGVLRPEFRFDNQPVDVYSALGRGDPLLLNDRTNHDILCLARLQTGANLGAARADMDSVQERIDQLNPATERGLGTEIEPLKQFLVGDVSGMLILLLGAAGLVLLIACANVANLLLSRSAGRTREFAVRQALGASRLQLVRQLVTESLVLSLAGGLLGLVIAGWGPKIMLAVIPGMPRVENVGVNGSVLLFAIGISVAVGVLFGLLPALKSVNVDLQTSLKAGSRGSAGGQQRTQGALVIVQVALALVLLIGGGLLLRTIRNLWAANPGFDVQRVITFQVGLALSATETPPAVRTAYQQLLERIRHISGVQAADMTAPVPLSQQDNSGPFWLGSHPPTVSVAEIPRALYFWTGPDYLRTMEIPLLRGRFLSEKDTHNSEPVIVIDSLLARTYFADRDPIGQTVTVPHWGTARVVGVVGHVRHAGLDDSSPLRNKPEIYASFYQLLDAWVPAFRNNLRITVRTSLDATALIPTIQRTVYGTDNGQPVYNVHTMQEIVSESIASRRFSMMLLGAFAALALLLACIGIYGVVAYSMTQRVREIGIRMALGAVKRDVLRMVIGQGLRLAVSGVIIGTTAALLLTRSLSSFSHLLYGVGAGDPLTFIGIPLALLSSSLLACYLPARRAAQLEPISALRHE